MGINSLLYSIQGHHHHQPYHWSGHLLLSAIHPLIHSPCHVEVVQAHIIWRAYLDGCVNSTSANLLVEISNHCSVNY